MRIFKYFKHRTWILLSVFLFFLFSFAHLEAQEKKVETVPVSEQGTVPPRPTETDLALVLTERLHERLLEIQEEQKTLKERIDEGQKDLDNEIQRVPSFLEIEEITAQEYQPYLD